MKNYVKVIRSHLPSFQVVTFLMTMLITLALIGLVYYSIQTLSSRDWCGQIMAAEKYTGSKTLTNQDTVQLVIGSCTKLVNEQLQSVGLVAKILAGALALSVVAMYLVKFAGAQASGGFAGGNFNIKGADDTHDHIKEAADRVADAATVEAAAVKSEVDDADVAHPQIAEEEKS